MKWNYNYIKSVAKETKIKTNKLFVLSPGNDPFYVGSPGQIEKAKWFGQVYRDMGSPLECHVRRVHYWLVSQEPKYKKPDGTEYQNTDKDWLFLTLCSKYARYAKTVPIENIIDRRNPPPKINIYDIEDETPTEAKNNINAESIIDDIVRRFRCWWAVNTQKYHIEIWCEKSTMNDVLEPIASKYGLNLVTGLGELSITACYLLIKRIKEIKKPVRIFYISDFDPAGECMPISVARKIEYFIRDEGLEDHVKLKQIMLTPKQCLQYQLPRTPIKSTEKRKEGFEERHGQGATELDALEALHSGEMKKIITNKILKYIDVGAWNEVVNKNDEVKKKVRDFLQDKIGNILEKLDLSEYDDYKPPRGSEINDDDDWIYDSLLDYLEQLKKYDEFKS